MRRAAFAFLIGFAAVLLMACAHPSVRIDTLGSYSGVTFCVRPAMAVSVLNLEVWGTADMLTTPAHEAKHREQFRRWPSCRAFRSYFATTRGYLASEGEAYAAGYCAGRKAGLDSAEVYDDMRQRFRNVTHDRVAESVADSAFNAFPC